MSRGWLITGTDTGCGKTEVTLGLMAALQARGYQVLGMKPVASGCEPTAEGLRNEDALRIQAQGSLPVPYDQVNPYALAPPIAPYIAAAQAGIEIRSRRIKDAYTELQAQADLVLVEGVGGWRVPLGAELFLSDLPRLLELPVILVVGIRLGCLNHALLTAESIIGQGNRLAAWVANWIDPQMLALRENLDVLSSLIPAPCLGMVPWLAGPGAQAVSVHLDLEPLALGEQP
ncbi:dethiobiotin synthase [Caldichromatium japonicum]|uniref:ATP-dependent dethiobiotin synthetase BioD n=1 Tax=Caldichromatium japonicum TaxID=2699430 RepID=A0A6G7VCR7_9GAMM|nr:dethiobiotin synthase [Caldichromatium japonicum]QIK37648.1 dethiobiotin synthase [Caldichromatium japonicum]